MISQLIFGSDSGPFRIRADSYSAPFVFGPIRIRGLSYSGRIREMSYSGHAYSGRFVFGALRIRAVFGKCHIRADSYSGRFVFGLEYFRIRRLRFRIRTYVEMGRFVFGVVQLCNRTDSEVNTKHNRTIIYPYRNLRRSNLGWRMRLGMVFTLYKKN